MSDLFLDFRPKSMRRPPRMAARVKFYDDNNTYCFDFEPFSQALTRPNDSSLWGPYRSSDGGSLSVYRDAWRWNRVSGIALRGCRARGDWPARPFTRSIWIGERRP
jgi:hypothetical protein